MTCARRALLLAHHGIFIAFPLRMAGAERHAWRAGDRLIVRGALWQVLERSTYVDCESLRLRGAREPATRSRTVLLPFDRPRPLPDARCVRVVRPRAWLHRLHAAIGAARPAGGLSAAAGAAISILSYQLEPALLMRRDGVPRIMIADGVGLGKTIQAGLLLNELAAEHDGLRALVVVPAGLREQWTSELAAHLRLDTITASSSWLARAASDLPADVNPWGLPGIYVASSDLVKRPEVLRPLEDLTWDVLIVDEAHEATIGTARRAAVHAIACRARRVVLLTATPHAGDAGQFAALCDLGAHDAASPAIVMFRRSRADVASHTPRRTAVLPIRLSRHEQRMHRLLEAYTSRLCEEARGRGNLQPRLVAIVLRKRALSSAASLAASCTRRLALIDHQREPADERQLQLPLVDEDPLADAEPEAVLGAPGLADAARERQWLAEIAAAAHRASAGESKIRFLRRLLARINEPAIVFTEYRDTLERLRDELSRLRPDLQVLHGGMDLRDRGNAQIVFNTRSSLLLATDAASEGLNLHGRCRLVIHFELPWSPVRLEQRTGRVDRIGQSRRVHEVLLVAADTAERVVLAPLLGRAARSRSALPHGSTLMDALGESQIAAAVIDGMEVGNAEPQPACARFAEPPATLHQEALAEAARLNGLRRGHVDRSSDTGCLAPVSGATGGTFVRRSRRLGPGIFAVYKIMLATTDGSMVHCELAVAHCHLAAGHVCHTPAALRRLVSGFRRAHEPHARELVQQTIAPHLDRISSRWHQGAAALADRERAIIRSRPGAAAQLVQAGLFDQRALRASTARSYTSARLIEDAERRIALASSAELETCADLCAVLVVGTR